MEIIVDEMNNRVEKAEMAVSADSMITQNIPYQQENRNRRAANVWFFSELQGITGRDKYGKQITGTVERPLFGLTIEDRIDIFKRSSVIFGVITSRMNKISSMEWRIEKKTVLEDRIAENLKNAYQLWNEYNDPGNVMYRTFQMKMYQIIKNELIDVKNDLSNFTTAMLRWKRALKNRAADKSEEITEWLASPNIEDSFSNYLKKWTFDLLIHGCFVQYKEMIDGLVENIYGLPGGSVTPLKSKYVGGGRAYVQMIQGMDAKIYFDDELSFCNYLPSTGLSYGHVPLEALVNKVAETLLFDQVCAERADGTKPPEKAVIFGGQFPFGELTGDASEQYKMPVPAAEQKRVETLLNEPRRNAIRTLTGIGTPLVLDLSKADTFPFQQERQRAIREEVGLVFNMTNMEMNMSGSDSVSGRNTAEEQSKQDREKGIYPIIQIQENVLNNEILPLRFPSDYKFYFKSGLSDKERMEMERMKMDSGTYSPNEIRIERGDEPWPEKDYDRPQGTKTPDGSQGSPLNMRSIE